jgi:uncharacterized protein YndB with AHSA1/START domain
MKASSTLPGDRARVSVRIGVSPADAFAVFTEEIDLWWRRGLRFRASGRCVGTLVLEARPGGCLFERFDTAGTPQIVEVGRITTWEPPSRLVFEWRNLNFAPDEKTEVEVRFDASESGTIVTVEHRGWSALRAGHPARHGLEGPAFSRMIGLWWGDLMTALREHVSRHGENPRGK